MQEVSHYLYRGSWGGEGGGEEERQRGRLLLLISWLSTLIMVSRVINHSQLLELSLIYIYASLGGGGGGEGGGRETERKATVTDKLAIN